MGAEQMENTRAPTGQGLVFPAGLRSHCDPSARITDMMPLPGALVLCEQEGGQALCCETGREGCTISWAQPGGRARRGLHTCSCSGSHRGFPRTNGSALQVPTQDKGWMALKGCLQHGPRRGWSPEMHGNPHLSGHLSAFRQSSITRVQKERRAVLNLG